MRYFLRPALAGALGFLGATAGCDQSAPTSTQETSLSVTVAPLDLPNMTDACYGLTVFNTTDTAAFGAETQVWTQPDLCASQYGADGGIRFTGICDAQATGATHDNAIRLVLNNVYANGDHTSGTPLAAGSDYVNPCPAPVDVTDDNGCILTAPCTENQDSKIVFNLTVMRNAELGFFDTVVKFEDLFCAAKLDCVEDDGTTTLEYLPIPGATPPADGPTAVLAFACTAGEGAAGNYMYLDPVVVTCKDAGGAVTRTATVDPSAGPGTVTPTDPGAILFGAAVNRGDGLNGAQYWNVLLGMNLPAAAGETCTLTTTGTASESPLTGYETPTATRYPVIEWNVDLADQTGRLCARHPLNNSGDDVRTIYTAIDAPASFTHQLLRVASTPGEVATFDPCADATVYDGNLDVYGPSAAALAHYREITGYVDIELTTDAEIYLPCLERVGDLAIRNTQVTSVRLPKLASAASVAFDMNPNLAHFELPRLAGDLNSLVFADLPSLAGPISLPGVTSVAYTLRLENTGATALEMAGLAAANASQDQGGWWAIVNNPNLQSIDFSGVITAGEINLQSNTALTTLDLGSLTVARWLFLNNLPSLVGTLDLPHVVSLWGASIGNTGLGVHSVGLSALSMPNLVTSGQITQIEGNANLSSLALGSLADSGIAMQIFDNPNLSSCDVDALFSQLGTAGWSGGTANHGNLACQ